jgi:hypothetical protein
MNNPYEIIRFLRVRVIQLETALDAEKAAHANTLNLLMTGEGQRDRLMIEAILAGAFSHKPATEKEQHGTNSPAI